jgi:hypothetical protein
MNMLFLSLLLLVYGLMVICPFLKNPPRAK